MATPISSPQNAIALGESDPPISWLSWLVVSIPICILSNIGCWWLLLSVYRPCIATPRIQPIRHSPASSDSHFTHTQFYVIFVSIFTILLWCFESVIRDWVGNSGVIALVPMVAFFGCGVLNKDDFNNFLWSVVMLAMGGVALGSAVTNSGLLATVAMEIKNFLGPQDVWVVLVVFSLLVLVVATFISHTVSALILLPLVHAVGTEMGNGKSNVLILGVALICSAAMGLPVSGFPNISAISLEDPTGIPYVSTKDFLMIGVPTSILVFLLVISVGYSSMLLIGV